jgi:hypothetical protein
MAALQGPEFEEFPNKALAGAHDGGTGLAMGGVLAKRVEELKEKLDHDKKEREALDNLARLRQKLLRSRWVRIGLMLGLCRALVSNQGKKAQEKLEALRETCQGHWWVKVGEKVGSQSCYELRRALV